jgi:hypothetical protein
MSRDLSAMDCVEFSRERANRIKIRELRPKKALLIKVPLNSADFLKLGLFSAFVS